MLMIGIDEVGRGCWAGPLLVVAAREKTALPSGLRDSKKISKKQRENLLDKITLSCDIGEGWVDPQEIDTLGLTGAMKLGVARALESLACLADETIVMDGTINFCDPVYTNVTCVARADDTHPVVSAASIYAKVLRDNHMAEVDKDFPEYGFAKHVGYGTADHKRALQEHGVTLLHRKSYKPVQALL